MGERGSAWGRLPVSTVSSAPCKRLKAEPVVAGAVGKEVVGHWAGPVQSLGGGSGGSGRKRG